jgi:hypothetical protein
MIIQAIQPDEPAYETHFIEGVEAIQMLVKIHGEIVLDFSDNLNAKATTSSLVRITSPGQVGQFYLPAGGGVIVRIPKQRAAFSYENTAERQAEREAA